MESRKIQTEQIDFGNKHIAEFGKKIKWILQGPKYVCGYWYEMTTGMDFTEWSVIFKSSLVWILKLNLLNVLKH